LPGGLGYFGFKFQNFVVSGPIGTLPAKVAQQANALGPGGLSLLKPLGDGGEHGIARRFSAQQAQAARVGQGARVQSFLRKDVHYPPVCFFVTKDNAEIALGKSAIEYPHAPAKFRVGLPEIGDVIPQRSTGPVDAKPDFALSLPLAKTSAEGLPWSVGGRALLGACQGRGRRELSGRERGGNSDIMPGAPQTPVCRLQLAPDPDNPL
jgi:hypothetical protein